MQQARLGDLPLQRLFKDAGIRPGMRVLDIGSGAGDVALTAASIVGHSGSVVGVDIDPAVLETARERAKAAGLGNVSFVALDLTGDATPEGAFDAIVGRVVLRYLPDPTGVIRRLMSRLRPGGLAVFSEPDGTMSPFSYPTCPLIEQVISWARQAQAQAGADLAMGLKLYRTLLDAGLAAPRLRSWSGFAAAPEFGVSDSVAAIVRSLLPRIVEYGIARAEDVDIETLAERLRNELTEQRAILMGPVWIDAWARKP
jgi:ubiquinone/menaquinone biosynthesis C-methylase UbiE